MEAILCYFGGSEAGFGPFLPYLWGSVPGFGPFLSYLGRSRARIWPISVLFQGFWPGFAPFLPYLGHSGPGFGPFLSYFGGSGPGFGPFLPYFRDPIPFHRSHRPKTFSSPVTINELCCGIKFSDDGICEHLLTLHIMDMVIFCIMFTPGIMASVVTRHWDLKNIQTTASQFEDIIDPDMHKAQTDPRRQYCNATQCIVI